MKTFFAAASIFVASAKALYTRTDSSCCFGLSAVVSGVSSTIGQLSDGQNRAGGGLTPASFCLKDTSITDGNGRPCVITSPETQFQCDSGSVAAKGFSIGCDGLLAHDGSTTFYQCQTGQNGESNIYITPGGTACTQITLSVQGNSCVPACPSSSPPTQKSCPVQFTDFQYPHLLVPIDSGNAGAAAGTSYFLTVSPTTSTLINFDIPASYAGRTCSLVFLFPAQSALETSSFTFSGNGALSFSELSGVASLDSTWNSRPGTKTTFGDVTVAPGASAGGYVITTFACPAGQAVGFEVGVGEGGKGNTKLKLFQDYNPSAIGAYIFPC